MACTGPCHGCKGHISSCVLATEAAPEHNAAHVKAVEMSDRKLVMWSMVGVVALAAVGALAIWLIRDKSVSCRTWEANVPNSYGHKLITVNSACEGIASSDAVSIELVNARGDRVRV